MAVDFSHYRLTPAIRKCDNEYEVFRNTLEAVAEKVDFSHVKSCVSFDTGNGQRQIDFARRLLPNLRSFTAFEKDPEVVKRLRAKYQDVQLPGVETSVVEGSVEGTMESWSGVDTRVDVVLLFRPNVLLNVDRKALFQQLMTRYLSDGGMVVTTDQYSPLRKRLEVPTIDFDGMGEELMAAGFRVVFEQEFQCYRDLSNPSADAVRMFEMMSGRSEEEVRTAIDEVFGRPDGRLIRNKLMIFAK